MRGTIVLSLLLLASFAAASNVEDEDSALASLKDEILGSSTASVEEELNSMEKHWESDDNGESNDQDDYSAPSGSSSGASGDFYKALACPRGYVRNHRGKCVPASSSHFHESTADTDCGVNMVKVAGVCQCRRGFHYVGGKRCEANHPAARLCKKGWFYYRATCVRKCPAPYSGDIETRHCVIADRPETQAALCGKNMRLIDGICVCHHGYKKALNGDFCIPYVKRFKSCRKGYFLSGKKCVKRCPSGLIGEKKTRRCMTQDDINALKQKEKSALDTAAEAAALARKRARDLLRAKEAALAKKGRDANARALAAAAALKRARDLVASLEKQLAAVKSRHWTKDKDLAAAVGRAKSLSKKIRDWKLKLHQAIRDYRRVQNLIKSLRALHKRLSWIEREKSRALAKAKARADALAKALAKAKAAAIARARRLADLKAKALIEAMRRARAAARAKARDLARKRALDLAKARERADALARAEALARKRAADLARQQADALRQAADLAAKRRQALRLAQAKANQLRKRQRSALRHCRDKAAQRKEALAAARKLAAARLAAKDAKLKALARARDLARAKANAARRARDAAKANAEYIRQLAANKKHCHPVRGCPSLTGRRRHHRHHGSSIGVIRVPGIRVVRIPEPRHHKKPARKHHKRHHPHHKRHHRHHRRVHTVLVKCRKGHVRKGLLCVPVNAAASS